MKRVYKNILTSPRKREGILYLLVSTSLLFILMRSASQDAISIDFSNTDTSYYLFVLINAFIYAVPITLALAVGALGIGIFVQDSGRRVSSQSSDSSGDIK